MAMGYEEKLTKERDTDREREREKEKEKKKGSDEQRGRRDTDVYPEKSDYE